MTKSPDTLASEAIRTASETGKQGRLQLGGGLWFYTLKGRRVGRWIYKGRIGGTKKQIDLTLGYYADGMRYADAASKRDEVRPILAQGVDPSAKDAAEQIDVQKLFGGVAAAYFDDMRRTGRSAHNIGIEDSRVKRYLAALADRPVNEVTRGELRDIVRAIADNHGANLARRIAGIISRIFAFAQDEGLIAGTPAQDITRGILERVKGEENHFAAAVTAEDAAPVFARIWQDTDEEMTDAAFALRVLTLMPVRVGSLLAARWEDLATDEDGNFVTWTFPQTKNGRAYTLPVCDMLNRLLQDKRRCQIEQGRDRGLQGYVFQGRDPGNALTSRALGMRFRSTGIAAEKQTLHGLRATFQTVLANQGAPLSCIEEALFHVLPSRTQRAYFRGCNDARMRELFTQWESNVAEWIRPAVEV